MGLLKMIAEKGLVKESVHLEKVDLPSEKYLTLAQKAGFEHAATAIQTATRQTTNEQFKQFLAENGITVYPEGKVNSYMWIITPCGYQWEWHRVSLETASWHYNINSNGSYALPIPEPVLMTMAKIRESYPEAFFQATVVMLAPKVDPFLRVTVDGTNWYIIERWDEPGFRM